MSFLEQNSDHIIRSYARSMARLMSLREMNAPKSMLIVEEKLGCKYLAECNRRGMSAVRLKDAADEAIAESQTKRALERSYDVTAFAPLTLPYVGKENRHQLRCRMAQRLIEGLQDAMNDPYLMRIMLQYKRV